MPGLNTTPQNKSRYSFPPDSHFIQSNRFSLDTTLLAGTVTAKEDDVCAYWAFHQGFPCYVIFAKEGIKSG